MLYYIINLFFVTVQPNSKHRELLSVKITIRRKTQNRTDPIVRSKNNIPLSAIENIQVLIADSFADIGQFGKAIASPTHSIQNGHCGSFGIFGTHPLCPQRHEP